jgi:hypothetical protein
MISFKRLDIKDMPWDKLSAFSDSNIFHTLPWLNFMANVQRAEPVVAAVESAGEIQGYFTGLIIYKYGLRILGSPFRGWSTYFMGFNLMPGVSYHEVLKAFPKFAFEELKCHYIEITDVNLKEDELKGLSYRVSKIRMFALDLTKSEKELFANMENRSCRQHIHKAIKNGVEIEETTDPGFADEYYAQYKELMAKKSLAPFYGLNLVKQMIEQLQPTGNLFLLRARNPEGVNMATEILLVYNKVAVGWGTASWQQYRVLHSNELIYWYAMKKAKAMGAEVLHLGPEVRRFKEKFGAHEIQVFRLMKARNPLLYIPLYAGLSIFRRVRLWMFRIMGK